MQVSAEGYSQRITISEKNAPLKKVFKEIEKQSGFVFWYEASLIPKDTKIDVSVKNGELKDVLEICFANQPLTYSILGKTIVLKGKATPFFRESIKQNENVIITSITVKGRVVNEKGAPLSGVSVTVKGSEKGTSTNGNGEYELANISENGILVFSFVGYETQSVSVKGRSVINVTLAVNLLQQEEVVVVGYGTTKRRDLTGSVSKIDMKSMEESSPLSFDNALVGQAPGVYVVPSSGEPGAAATIRIRGTSSIVGNNEPLYVIDGIPIEVGHGLGNDLYQDNYNTSISPLAGINPQDIESIDILKDASATAIYGSRGANGVVIVTTKKGSYSSIPSIKLSGNVSISKFAREYNMLSGNELKSVVEQAYENAGVPLPNSQLLFPFGENVNTDWQKETQQPAITQNYYINVNGGSLSGKTLYSISANNFNEDGPIYNTYFKRNNIRTRLETDLSKNLRIGSNFNYSDSKKKGSDLLNYYEIVTFSPYVPIFDEDGNYASVSGGSANPYSKARYKSTITDENLQLSLFAELKFTKALIFKSQIFFNNSDGTSFSYIPSYDPTEIRRNSKGTLFQEESQFDNRIFDNTLSFAKKIKNHNIYSLVGASYSQSKSKYLDVEAHDFPDDDATVTPGAASRQKIKSGGTISGLSSYFVRLNYNYSNKYYATFTGRADQSTKFGPKYRWGYFPSGALAWRISDENFMRDFNVVKDLKLRLSYGKTGSANFSDFQYATFFESGSFYDGRNGVIANNIPNPDIRWETTNQFDVAIDFSLLDKRINGTIEYFDKKTKDLILYRDIVYETGARNQYANIGDFSNKGLEFQISADVFDHKNFQWTTELNISSIKSKVLRLNDGYYRDLKEGEAVGNFIGHQIAGIFQSQKEIDALNSKLPTGVYQKAKTTPGDFKFIDINNDGFIGDGDMTKIGNPAPDFFGGFINTIRFRNFEVYALFNFSIGNYLVNSNRRYLQVYNGYGYNYEEKILDAWAPANTKTNIPRIVYGDPNNNSRLSDFFIEDASFLKLKTINLRYKVDPKLLDNMVVKKADIFFSVSNVFTITK